MSLSRTISTACMVALSLTFSVAPVMAQSTPPKTSVEAIAEPVKPLKSADFKSEVEDSKLPVIVDFYATWCGPCKLLKPNLDAVAKEFQGKVKFAKVDVDQCRDLVQKYDIKSVPSLLIFKDGKLKEIRIGSQTPEQLRETCKQLSK